MLLSALITELRNALSDVEVPYLWSDSEFLSYIRDTLSDIYSTTQYSGDIYSEFNTIVGQATYPIQGLVKNMWEAQTNIFFDRITDEHINSLPVVTGLPTKFVSYDDSVKLYPTPNKVYSINFIYQSIPNVLTTSDNLVFSDFNLLKLGVMSKAYLKQDSEVFDDRAYTKLKQEYISALHVFKNNYVRDWHHPSVSLLHRGLF